MIELRLKCLLEATGGTLDTGAQGSQGWGGEKSWDFRVRGTTEQEAQGRGGAEALQQRATSGSQKSTPGTGFLCNANLTMVTMQHGKCT